MAPILHVAHVHAACGQGVICKSPCPCIFFCHLQQYMLSCFNKFEISRCPGPIRPRAACAAVQIRDGVLFNIEAPNGQKVGQATVFGHWAFEDGREGGPNSGAAPAEAGPPTDEQLAAAEEAVAEQARCTCLWVWVRVRARVKAAGQDGTMR